jgi:hypothetical protein
VVFGKSEIGGDMFPRNVGYLSSGYSQKVELFRIHKNV